MTQLPPQPRQPEFELNFLNRIKIYATHRALCTVKEMLVLLILLGIVVSINLAVLRFAGPIFNGA